MDKDPEGTTLNRVLTNKLEKPKLNLVIVENEETETKMQKDEVLAKPYRANSLSSHELPVTKIEAIKKKLTFEDFEIYRSLGKGSYAKVYLAKNKLTNQIVALKAIEKKFVEKEGKSHEVLIEKHFLSMLHSPHVIQLSCTFQDTRKVYFCIEYAANGNLSELIRSHGVFTENLAVHYAAEILLAIEYLGSQGVIHRDLKPENIVLDQDYHLKIVDFATATLFGKTFDKKTKKFKIIEPDDELDNFVGTAEYVSPEVISNSEIGYEVDLWSLGIMIYQFFNGETPFRAVTEFLTMDNVLNKQINLSKLPQDAADIVKKILERDPKKRIGCKNDSHSIDYGVIKSHAFFKSINFETIKETPPPISFIKLQSPVNKFSGYSTSPSSKKDSTDSRDPVSSKSISKFESKCLSPSPMASKSHIFDFKHASSANFLVFEEVVDKKSPWFHYNTRLLKLYSHGLLEYYKNENELRGAINLESDSQVVKIDTNKFEVITQKRTYKFRVLTDNTDKWVELINECIKNLAVK